MLIDRQDLRPLLDAIDAGADGDPDGTLRLLLLDTLRCLPLNEAAWREIAPLAVKLMMLLTQQGRLDAPACAVFLALPLGSVRHFARRLAGGDSDASKNMRQALTGVQDALDWVPPADEAVEHASRIQALMQEAVGGRGIELLEVLQQLHDLSGGAAGRGGTGAATPPALPRPAVALIHDQGKRAAPAQGHQQQQQQQQQQLQQPQQPPPQQAQRQQSEIEATAGADGPDAAGSLPPESNGADAAAAPSPSPAPSPAPAPMPIQQVYPSIDADDLHPVAGQRVTIEVGLQDSAAPGVAGSAHLPARDRDVVQILKVHLLWGDFSAWDELHHSLAAGTVRKARFTLDAPACEEQQLGTVRVNFYLDQRWCGEGLRHLDLRPDATVAPLARIPTPALPPWHEGLVLAPGATPADLLVRIQRGDTAGEYFWSCLSPHGELPAPATPAASRMLLGSDAETFVRNLFKPLADQPLQAMDIVDLEGAGETIYRATPAVFKQAYWTVWRWARDGGFAFDAIQIVTDEPCVPWELMRVYDDIVAPEEPAEILSVRHAVGRWLASESGAPVQSLPVRQMAVSTSDYVGVDSVTQKLPWTTTERDWLVQHCQAQSVPLRSGPLLHLLQTGQVQALHIACHGKMSITAPETSYLVLEDAPNRLKPTAIARTDVRRGIGRERPLVFLNACEVGGSAASLGLVAGFPGAFLAAGAGAVVCPLWAVSDERSARIAQDFYTAVMRAEGATLGEVLREVRSTWRSQGHLTYLAYVLYGDPQARVHYTG